MYYSVQEAARALKISADTLRRWEREGKFSPQRTLGGHRRYTLEDISKIKNQRSKTPVSQEIPNLYSTLPIPQRAVFRSFVFLSLISFVVFVFVRSGFVGFFVPVATKSVPQVLQASTSHLPVILAVNVPAVFRDSVTFDTGITSSELATLGDLDIVGTLSLSGQGVDASAVELNYLTGITITQGALVYNTATGLASTTAGSSGQLLTSAGTTTPTWTSPSSLTVGDAGALDGIDSGSFLRSDTSDSFTSGTLTFNSGTTLQINGGSKIGTGTPGSVDLVNDLYITDDLEVDGTIFGAFSGSINPGFTTGSVVFIDAAGLAQDNTNFFWEDTANELRITGTAFFTNNTSSNIIIDLTSTGDFTVSQSGTPFVTFNSNGDKVLADGALLDLSLIVHDDSAAQGIKLPQATSFTAISSGGEGYLAWDTDGNNLAVFDGTNWTA